MDKMLGVTTCQICGKTVSEVFAVSISSNDLLKCPTDNRKDYPSTKVRQQVPRQSHGAKTVGKPPARNTCLKANSYSSSPSSLEPGEGIYFRSGRPCARKVSTGHRSNECPMKCCYTSHAKKFPGGAIMSHPLDKIPKGLPRGSRKACQVYKLVSPVHKATRSVANCQSTSKPRPPPSSVHALSRVLPSKVNTEKEISCASVVLPGQRPEPTLGCSQEKDLQLDHLLTSFMRTSLTHSGFSSPYERSSLGSKHISHLTSVASISLISKDQVLSIHPSETFYSSATQTQHTHHTLHHLEHSLCNHRKSFFLSKIYINDLLYKAQVDVLGALLIILKYHVYSFSAFIGKAKPWAAMKMRKTKKCMNLQHTVPAPEAEKDFRASSSLIKDRRLRSTQTFSETETQLNSNKLDARLEWHVKKKPLEQIMGVPAAVQRSLRLYMPLAPMSSMPKEARMPGKTVPAAFHKQHFQQDPTRKWEYRRSCVDFPQSVNAPQSKEPPFETHQCNNLCDLEKVSIPATHLINKEIKEQFEAHLKHKVMQHQCELSGQISESVRQALPSTPETIKLLTPSSSKPDPGYCNASPAMQDLNISHLCMASNHSKDMDDTCSLTEKLPVNTGRQGSEIQETHELEKGVDIRMAGIPWQERTLASKRGISFTKFLLPKLIFRDKMTTRPRKRCVHFLEPDYLDTIERSLRHKERMLFAGLCMHFVKKLSIMDPTPTNSPPQKMSLRSSMEHIITLPKLTHGLNGDINAVLSPSSKVHNKQGRQTSTFPERHKAITQQHRDPSISPEDQLDENTGTEFVENKMDMLPFMDRTLEPMQFIDIRSPETQSIEAGMELSNEDDTNLRPLPVERKESHITTKITEDEKILAIPRESFGNFSASTSMQEGEIKVIIIRVDVSFLKEDIVNVLESHISRKILQQEICTSTKLMGGVRHATHTALESTAHPALESTASCFCFLALYTPLTKHLPQTSHVNNPLYMQFKCAHKLENKLSCDNLPTGRLSPVINLPQPNLEDPKFEMRAPPTERKTSLENVNTKLFPNLGHYWERQLKLRAMCLPFTDQISVDIVNWNLKQKHLLFLLGLPPAHLCYLNEFIENVTWLPPMIEKSKARTEFSAMKINKFLKPKVKEFLEWHILKKKLHHEWGMSSLHQRSVLGFMTVAPKPTKLKTYPKPGNEIVIIMEEAFFMSDRARKDLESHAKRGIIYRKVELPSGSSETMALVLPRVSQDKVLPSHQIQEDVSSTSVKASGLTNSTLSPSIPQAAFYDIGVDLVGESKKGNGALHLIYKEVPIQAGPQDSFEVDTYLTMKCNETQTARLCPVVCRSQTVFRFPKKRFLPILICLGERQQKPMVSSSTCIDPTSALGLAHIYTYTFPTLQWGLQAHHLRSLSEISLAPILFYGSGTSIEFFALLLKPWLRVYLEWHVKNKRLRHEWGVPASLLDASGTLVSSLSRWSFDAASALNTISVESSFLNEDIRTSMESNLKERCLQKVSRITQMVPKSMESVKLLNHSNSKITQFLEPSFMHLQGRNKKHQKPLLYEEPIYQNGFLTNVFFRTLPSLKELKGNGPRTEFSEVGMSFCKPYIIQQLSQRHQKKYLLVQEEESSLAPNLKDVGEKENGNVDVLILTGDLLFMSKCKQHNQKRDKLLSSGNSSCNMTRQATYLSPVINGSRAAIPLSRPHTEGKHTVQPEAGSSGSSDSHQPSKILDQGLDTIYTQYTESCKFLNALGYCDTTDPQSPQRQMVKGYLQVNTKGTPLMVIAPETVHAQNDLASNMASACNVLMLGIPAQMWVDVGVYASTGRKLKHTHFACLCLRSLECASPSTLTMPPPGNNREANIAFTEQDMHFLSKKMKEPNEETVREQVLVCALNLHVNIQESIHSVLFTRIQCIVSTAQETDPTCLYRTSLTVIVIYEHRNARASLSGIQETADCVEWHLLHRLAELWPYDVLPSKCPWDPLKASTTYSFPDESHKLYTIVIHDVKPNLKIKQNILEMNLIFDFLKVTEMHFSIPQSVQEAIQSARPRLRLSVKVVPPKHGVDRTWGNEARETSQSFTCQLFNSGINNQSCLNETTIDMSTLKRHKIMNDLEIEFRRLMLKRYVALAPQKNMQPQPPLVFQSCNFSCLHYPHCIADQAMHEPFRPAQLQSLEILDGNAIVGLEVQLQIPHGDQYEYEPLVLCPLKSMTTEEDSAPSWQCTSENITIYASYKATRSVGTWRRVHTSKSRVVSHYEDILMYLETHVRQKILMNILVLPLCIVESRIIHQNTMNRSEREEIQKIKAKFRATKVIHGRLETESARRSLRLASRDENLHIDSPDIKSGELTKTQDTESWRRKLIRKKPFYESYHGLTFASQCGSLKDRQSSNQDPIGGQDASSEGHREKCIENLKTRRNVPSQNSVAQDMIPGPRLPITELISSQKNIGSEKSNKTAASFLTDYTDEAPEEPKLGATSSRNNCKNSISQNQTYQESIAFLWEKNIFLKKMMSSLWESLSDLCEQAQERSATSGVQGMGHAIDRLFAFGNGARLDQSHDILRKDKVHRRKHEMLNVNMDQKKKTDVIRSSRGTKTRPTADASSRGPMIWDKKGGIDRDDFGKNLGAHPTEVPEGKGTFKARTLNVFKMGRSRIDRVASTPADNEDFQCNSKAAEKSEGEELGHWETLCEKRTSGWRVTSSWWSALRCQQTEENGWYTPSSQRKSKKVKTNAP